MPARGCLGQLRLSAQWASLPQAVVGHAHQTAAVLHEASGAEASPPPARPPAARALLCLPCSTHLGRQGGHLGSARAALCIQLLPQFLRLGPLIPGSTVAPRRRQCQAVALRLLDSSQLGGAGCQGGLQLSSLQGNQGAARWMQGARLPGSCAASGEPPGPAIQGFDLFTGQRNRATGQQGSRATGQQGGPTCEAAAAAARLASARAASAASRCA